MWVVVTDGAGTSPGVLTSFIYLYLIMLIERDGMGKFYKEGDPVLFDLGALSMAYFSIIYVY